MGDALNWEWTMVCALREKSNVLIVSRDSDYCEVVDGKAYINDWLEEEFKMRVGKNKTVELTNRLSVALKRMAVPVSVEEETEEDNITAATSARKATARSTQSFDQLRRQLQSGENLQRFDVLLGLLLSGMQEETSNETPTRTSSPDRQLPDNPKEK